MMEWCCRRGGRQQSPREHHERQRALTRHRKRGLAFASAPPLCAITASKCSDCGKRMRFLLLYELNARAKRNAEAPYPGSRPGHYYAGGQIEKKALALAAERQRVRG